MILLDVMMPGLDGWQVAEELLDDDRHGGDPDRLPDRPRRVPRPGPRPRLGGIDYVTKPFNPLELAPLVRELVAPRRLAASARTLRREKIAELRDLIEPS